MCVEKEYTLLGIYAPAYTANLALACELYFKQLLVIRKIDVTENGRKIHKLKNLYLKIPFELQSQIENKYNEKIKPKKLNAEIEFMTLSECLDKYDTAFEDWRYTYEGNKKANTVAGEEFFVLVDVVKEIADEIVKKYLKVDPSEAKAKGDAETL